jgi:nitrate reductase molybdenum cofactor assembly chaperone NarJ/NarW
MAKTFKVLSALLSYPTEDLQAVAGELRAIVQQEGLIAGAPLARLGQLIGEIETGDLFDLQERYVLLFDRSRSLSLHLFEHLHGEGRDRGQALVDLAQFYERHGLTVEAKELPDYLPLYLEFLSTLPLDEARVLLAEPLHILAALKQRLRKRESPYASVFRALESIANAKPGEDGLKALSGDEDAGPDDLEALDKAWADEPVTFGPGAATDGGCSGDRVAARIRAALRPVSSGTRPFPKH